MVSRIPLLVWLAAALVAALVHPADLRAQRAGAALTYPDGSPHPVTPWGDPDLQGMWPIMHLFATNLQRNPQHGDRRFLTDEEWKRAQAARLLRALEDSPPPPEPKSAERKTGTA